MHMGATHWHARPDTVVEYIATDAANQTIPYVRVTDAQGKVTEYFAEGMTAPPRDAASHGLPRLSQSAGAHVLRDA